MITIPRVHVTNGDKDKRWTIIANSSGSTVNMEICKDSLQVGQTTFGVRSIEHCSSAEHYLISNEDNDIYKTDGQLCSGKLLISRLDTINKFISGTFYFDAINENGKVAEIRDGRFDLKYNFTYNP